MTTKKLEVIEIRLGIDIAAEIRRKTDAMADIELNLAKVSVKEKKDDKGPQWLEKCALVAEKLISTTNGLTKEQMCELAAIKDTQIPNLTGKLRSYLRLEHKMDLFKSKSGYFTRPIEQAQGVPAPQTQLDQQIVPIALAESVQPGQNTLPTMPD